MIDTENIKIMEIESRFEREAKRVILAGMEEYFGFIDHSLNPDLDDILLNYQKTGCKFLIAVFKARVIATAAVVKEDEGTARLLRMSVVKEFRRSGIGRRMLRSMERYAFQTGYRKLVLETHREWEQAIRFYIDNGYEMYVDDGQRAHMWKDVITNSCSPEDFS
ncbi:UNVERIFIED_CONTAM: GNAT family N-acetyltransferase [Halobacillus marinus]